MAGVIGNNIICNPKIDFSIIIQDNEKASRDALDRGDYLQAFLLIHTLIESLLRLFLDETDEDIKFSGLIKKYEKFFKEQDYQFPTLVKELTKFNKRRNRITHQLWKKGYSFTNEQANSAADGALILYGLTIEFLETWDSNITKKGFEYS
jgi:hypothetical protein